MLKVLEVFHHRVARRITGTMVQLTRVGEWDWYPVGEALETAGLCPIKEYTQKRQDTVASQLVSRTIYEMCVGAYWIPGMSKFMWWLEEDVGWEVE